MNHVAIDLGSRSSQVCVRDADGTVVFERKHPTSKLDALMSTWPPSRVVVETQSEAFHVADQARSHGHEVRVVDSRLSRMLGVGQRGIKTDLRDARALSEASLRLDLPSVHIPSSQARDFRARARTRELMLSSRTAIINHVRAWLRTRLLVMPGRGTTATFPERVRTFVKDKVALPSYLENALVALDTLNLQITQINREIRTLMRKNELARRLMTVPGVGWVTALVFIASIDDVSRFAHAYRVSSYLGLTPGENSSAERERRLGITKAGAGLVRKMLIQAAWHVMRRNEPMSQWARQIAERRGKRIAVVALARKMSTILYALWRDNTTYRANATNRPLVPVPEATPGR